MLQKMARLFLIHKTQHKVLGKVYKFKRASVGRTSPQNFPAPMLPPKPTGQEKGVSRELRTPQGVSAKHGKLFEIPRTDMVD